MYINKQSPIPLYYQLKQYILKQIHDRKWKPGDMIPSERELSEKSKISRMTVRQALNELVNEGFLYREKGKGTFVSRPKIIQNNLSSFTEIIQSQGMNPKTKLIEFETNFESKRAAKNLDLSLDKRFYRIKRLRLADNVPIVIEEAYIPVDYCPGLEEEDLEGSLYKIFEEKYNYQICAIDYNIEASTPSNDEKGLLNIKRNTPVLRIKGIEYTQNDLKLYYIESVYNSRYYIFNVVIIK